MASERVLCNLLSVIILSWCGVVHFEITFPVCVASRSFNTNQLFLRSLDIDDSSNRQMHAPTGALVLLGKLLTFRVEQVNGLMYDICTWFQQTKESESNPPACTQT